MKRTRRPGRLAALLALLYVALPAGATTVRPMNIVDLVDYAETIVAGRVENVTDGFAPNGMPYTEVTLRVIDRFRGAQGETFTFRQFGLMAPRTMPNGMVYLGGRPEGWPTFRTGEVSLLFLYPKARVTGFQTTVGLGYGKLGLGNGVALNGYDNATLFKGTGIDAKKLASDEQRMFDSKSGPVNAATLRKFLKRIAKDRPAPGSSHANP